MIFGIFKLKYFSVRYFIWITLFIQHSVDSHVITHTHTHTLSFLLTEPLHWERGGIRTVFNSILHFLPSLLDIASNEMEPELTINPEKAL